MEDKRVHLIIKGKVQGVFYRASAKDVAESLELKGFVKNITDGDVELVAEGPLSKLKRLEQWCKTGPPNARVDNIKTSYSPSTGEFVNFHIQY